MREPRSPDEVLAAASEHFSDREILAIHLVVGVYFMLARVMTNLELEMDDARGRGAGRRSGASGPGAAARGDEGG